MSTPISHFGLVLKSPNVIFSSLRTSQKTISCALEWSAHFRPPFDWFVGFLMAVGSKCAAVCEEIPRGINTRCIKQRVGNQNKIETLLFRCKIKILFGQMRDFQTLEHSGGYFLQCCHPRLDGLGALTGTIYIELAPRCYLLWNLISMGPLLSPKRGRNLE